MHSLLFILLVLITGLAFWRMAHDEDKPSPSAKPMEIDWLCRGLNEPVVTFSYHTRVLHGRAQFETRQKREGRFV